MVFLCICILGSVLVIHLDFFLPEVTDKLMDISHNVLVQDGPLPQKLASFTNASKPTDINSCNSAMNYKVKRGFQCENPFRSEYVANRNFLCCHLGGELGNHMFYYASAYGIAESLNRTLVFNKRNFFSEYFDVTGMLVDDYECVTEGSMIMHARLSSGFDQNLLKIPKGQNYCVGKFLQSYKYFEHVENDIRKQFTFRPEYRVEAKRIVEEALRTYRKRGCESRKKKPPVLVGVHIRRGDMVRTRDFNVATPQYIYRSVQYFRDKFQHVLFLVCSNGIDWAKKYIQGDDVVYIEGNSPGVDMAVLVSCDHTLSTVGTFSWWVGYLTGGETVYYKWPAREGSRLRKQFSTDYSDFFPPNWIGMS